MKALTAASLLLLLTSLGVAKQRVAGSGEFNWQLPPGFPEPRVPADNPMTVDKVELGRRLFHDPRLSGNKTLACADCHHSERAFTDGRPRAVGAEGDHHPRSSMSLINAAYNATFGWDDPTVRRLEDQALIPLMNTRPVEMGVAGRDDEVLARLRGDRHYRRLFARGFPDEEEPVTMRNVVRALAAFQRTLISGDSAFDRWAYGAETDALPPEARAGASLFFSRRLSCFQCHSGFNLSGPVVYAGADPEEPRFHDNGLLDHAARDASTEANSGVHRITGRDEDRGLFRAPTLRNIAVTEPYMHDGSIATLEAVIDHYAAGGRARSGSDAPPDPLITGFELTDNERRQLVSFLESLTDRRYLEAD